ncbi:MAG: DUF4172 domain-containing protein [Novosphingobium sp.]|uniref:DUF4172 domain-containing protein n=1 Tax=Novosphingobium sp. TaxID=1874826 RepID=UPI003B9C0465
MAELHLGLQRCRRTTGRMESLGFSLRAEAMLRTLAQEVLKFSEIEGKNLDTDQVRSSIARRLCPYIGALTPLIGIFSAAITRLRW